MSRTRIVKGKITEIIAKDYNIYSESSIIDNAAGIISDKGVAKGESYGNAKNPPPSTKLINTIVEFRTKQDGSYTGQFGFDWLRIEDNHFTTENTYFNCLENGYEAPNGKVPQRDPNTEYETKDEAFKALEKEYLQIPINRTAAPSITKYYVPWLNLYPESVSAESTSTVKPPFEAELRVLVDIQNEEPDQIRIIFDKNNFTIDGKDGTDANPIFIDDKAIGAKRDTAQVIKIKCIHEFSKRQEILVYGYPKDSLSKPLPEQLTLRKIVGKIVLEPNNNSPKSAKTEAVKNRKELKVVLVRVQTEIINGFENIGSFNIGDEMETLQNGLYQSLIGTEIIDKDSSGNDYIINVKNNINFKQKYNPTGVAIGSTYITRDNKIKANAHNALKTLFNTQTHNAFANNLLMFSFDEPGDGFVGVAEGIGKKSLILVKARNNRTMPHEALHCLGLYHTHRDAAIVYLNNITPASSTVFNPDYRNNNNCIYVGTDNSLWMFNGTSYVIYVFHEDMKPAKKFVYHHAHLASLLATDNLMSYNGILRKNTWHWQWKILKRNV